MSDEPSPKGGNGQGPERDAGGRFLPGWRGGPGNPYAGQVAALRAALLQAVTPADVEAVAKMLIRKARKGSIPAAKELLDRVLGRPGLNVRLGGSDETASDQIRAMMDRIDADPIAQQTARDLAERLAGIGPLDPGVWDA